MLNITLNISAQSTTFRTLSRWVALLPNVWTQGKAYMGREKKKEDHMHDTFLSLRVRRLGWRSLTLSLQDHCRINSRWNIFLLLYICDLAVRLDVIFVNIIFQVGDQFNLYVEAHDGTYFCASLQTYKCPSEIQKYKDFCKHF